MISEINIEAPDELFDFFVFTPGRACGTWANPNCHGARGNVGAQGARIMIRGVWVHVSPAEANQTLSALKD